LSRTLDCPVTDISPLGGGRNSRTYRITCDEGKVYAAKIYFNQGAEGQDRLGAEFSSLQFLWAQGVRSIPRPIVANAKQGEGVYEFIEGGVIDVDKVTSNDIDQAGHFLVALKNLAVVPEARHLPPAAEACFSIQSILDSLNKRMYRLSKLDVDTTAQEALRNFMEMEFEPLFHNILQWCGSNIDQYRLALDTELTHPKRTLSPSDFGFHNAIRRPDGTIVFLDFEYFGWDDPAKMIVDFLLHPALPLSDYLKRRFLSCINSQFEDETLPNRIGIVYPLFGLKWCLILLNEFVPEHLQRREFAMINNNLSVESLQFIQLNKSRKMMTTVADTYKHYPYYE